MRTLRSCATWSKCGQPPATSPSWDAPVHQWLSVTKRLFVVGAHLLLCQCCIALRRRSLGRRPLMCQALLQLLQLRLRGGTSSVQLPVSSTTGWMSVTMHARFVGTCCLCQHMLHQRHCIHRRIFSLGYTCAATRPQNGQPPGLPARCSAAGAPALSLQRPPRWCPCAPPPPPAPANVQHIGQAQYSRCYCGTLTDGQTAGPKHQLQHILTRR